MNGGTHKPDMHVLGERQSTLVWQGNAHLPYCVLQRWVPHGTSFWHWKATGPGTAIWPEGAPGGATVGLGAPGGGTGCGDGGGY
jgi:hypothetical protein